MRKELIDKNPLLKLSFEFSLLILEFSDLLNQLHKYAISKQLVRSGTSIGANSMEAQNAESRADFIHKIKIAAKEADETQYWITLCEFAKGYPDTAIISNKLTELQKIINAIIGTAKRKTPFSYFLSFFIF
ncbi:MAG: four helix bundle protein [Ferruginibacter sp.]